MKSSDVILSPFKEVLAAFAAGQMVIIIDAKDRENEGDLAVAAGAVSSEQLAFMMQQARGLICVSIASTRAKELNLPLQTAINNSRFGTPFAVGIDHRAVQDRGVTAQARMQTIRALVEPKTTVEDLVSPGHVFPLIAHDAGVIGRQGQTEGSFDLARLAGFEPAAVICEILNPDGSMARGAELNSYAQKHKLLITSVEEIIAHRVADEVLVREVGSEILVADRGRYRVHVFVDDVDGKEHLALVHGDVTKLVGPPLVRLHSECLTGDVFGSQRCDCGSQLAEAERIIAAEGAGVILYLRQEGRGIGLSNKLRAYELQDRGSDTVEANLALGFEADQRDFLVSAKILLALGISDVRLLTNNPRKVQALMLAGVQVRERIPLLVPATEYSRAYLETKRQKLGHLL